LVLTPPYASGIIDHLTNSTRLKGYNCSQGGGCLSAIASAGDAFTRHDGESKMDIAFHLGPALPKVDGSKPCARPFATKDEASSPDHAWLDGSSVMFASRLPSAAPFRNERSFRGCHSSGCAEIASSCRHMCGSLGWDTLVLWKRDGTSIWSKVYWPPG